MAVKRKRSNMVEGKTVARTLGKRGRAQK